MIADDVAKPEFGPEMMPPVVRREPQGQRPGLQRSVLQLVADTDIVAYRPVVAGAAQVPELPTEGRVLPQPPQGAPTLVVVRSVEVGHRLPLHVRLPGKHEHPDGFGSRGPQANGRFRRE